VAWNKKTSEAEQAKEENEVNTDPVEEENAAEGAEESAPETEEVSREAELEQKVAEMTDRLQRNMAEFDNFRKRTEKEKSARFEMGERNVIEKMLPVLDNFERGLATVTEEQKKDPFVEGMDRIYKQMVSVLEEMGVAPIEAVGKEFNPDFHNAVMHVEDEAVDENIIVEEFQKGYTYKGSVVRYSMVKVAN